MVSTFVKQRNRKNLNNLEQKKKNEIYVCPKCSKTKVKIIDYTQFEYKEIYKCKKCKHIWISDQ